MAKKEKRVDIASMEAEMRFMGTYGDAITLLMAFFVLLYAMSQVDSVKFQLLVAGLAGPFDNTAIEEGLLDMGTGIVGSGFTDPEVGEGVEAVELVQEQPRAVGDTADPTTERYLQSAEDLAEVQEAIVSHLQSFGLETSISQRIDERGLAVSIATDDVLFASGSPALSEKGREIIATLAPILTEFDNQVLIEGHTDTVPLNENGYTNWNLSADRALAVLEILQTSDINPTRLSATGYGEYRPVAENGTEEGRAANRRVELVIVAAGTEN
ncbi:MAG: flagellar motor protein MotB [Acidimicrobiia bacterium]|nr:flagellar motor protein MotB [Acidimicrobiia bacterium]MDH4307003.1 flagellar motor protein MotB [Acidimicrobiia bacterium]MDH5292233.1 flagellar motor protein MotB [Acidimicrobiia bacterium]